MEEEQGSTSQSPPDIAHEVDPKKEVNTMFKKVKYAVQPSKDITEILTSEDYEKKEKGVHSLNPTTNVVEEQSREIINTFDM